MSDESTRADAGTGTGGGTGADDAPVPEAPLLDEVMPWSVAPLRLGRGWVAAPDAAALRARWDTLIRTDDEAAREALFEPSRSRTLRSAVAPLPGTPAHDGRLVRERGGCPEPVRILHGPYDQQWLIPDHRLIDAARPQLWRVGDGHQTHLVETAHDHRRPGPLFTFTALLPDGRAPVGRPGRIRPLHRRPGGGEPNILPGLPRLLAARLDAPVAPEDLLAWIAAAARPGPGGRTVPLTADPELWRRGVALGRRVIWLHTRGARCAGTYGGARSGTPDGTSNGPAVGTTGDGATHGATGVADGVLAGRPRLPGGHRPYVRAPLPAPAAPGAVELRYDPEELSLHIGDGRVAPVAPAAWEFEAGGARVLEDWFAQRAAKPAAPTGQGGGTLAAVHPREWPQEWTSELLELITVLTLLAELRPEQRDLARELDSAGSGAVIGRTELSRAGLLPVPAASRRPASVLDVPEEGPEGQLALL